MTALPSRAEAKRPRLITLANEAVRTLSNLGVGSDELREHELVAAARARTGLHDFGDEWFREALNVLVDSINREARLHPVGRWITKTRLVSALSTRLLVHEHLRQNPEIEKLELLPPIVIAGLQRTGTTMLHRLLASDPALRALLSFEAIAPTPPQSARWGDPRKLKAKASEQALLYMAPEFFAIHPVEAHAPEEDVLLLDYSFLSTVPEATMHVPSYSRWLEQQDHTRAYEYMKTLLKVMSHARGPRRWVLKTPHHLEYLDVLRNVFRGASVVQTHRDPAQTLASFCSMVWHGRRVFSDEVDAHEIGRHWSHKIGRMLENSLTAREHFRDEGCIDVSYEDLVENPIAAIERLYPRLGLTWSDEVRRRMDVTRADNPQHKYGKHSYHLSDFGLDPKGIEPLFARYRARFGDALKSR